MGEQVGVIHPRHRIAFLFLAVQQTAAAAAASPRSPAHSSLSTRRHEQRPTRAGAVAAHEQPTPRQGARSERWRHAAGEEHEPKTRQVDVQLASPDDAGPDHSRRNCARAGSGRGASHAPFAAQRAPCRALAHVERADARRRRRIRPYAVNARRVRDARPGYHPLARRSASRRCNRRGRNKRRRPRRPRRRRPGDDGCQARALPPGPPCAGRAAPLSGRRHLPPCGAARTRLLRGR